MRILKFLFTSLLIISIIAGLSGLLARELLLLWGTSNVRSSLTELQSISRNATEYVRLCRQKGTPNDQNAIDHLQLRFTSSSEYVLEVLCSQFLLDPIVIREGKLPPFVMKSPGSAGVIWGTDRSGVTIETFGRRRSILVENRSINSAPPNVSLGNSPESSCNGYGYMCCQNETQMGTGTQFTQVNDCPKSCFQQCVARPVVLSFTSDPFPENRTRTVSIQDGDSVSFSYVASYEGKVPARVRLEYGDGEFDNFSSLTGDGAHTYSCPSNECRYTATVTVTVGENTISADTPITQIEVVVRK